MCNREPSYTPHIHTLYFIESHLYYIKCSDRRQISTRNAAVYLLYNISLKISCINHHHIKFRVFFLIHSSQPPSLSLPPSTYIHVRMGFFFRKSGGGL